MKPKKDQILFSAIWLGLTALTVGASVFFGRQNSKTLNPGLKANLFQVDYNMSNDGSAKMTYFLSFLQDDSIKSKDIILPFELNGKEMDESTFRFRIYSSVTYGNLDFPNDTYMDKYHVGTTAIQNYNQDEKGNALSKIEGHDAVYIHCYDGFPSSFTMKLEYKLTDAADIYDDYTYVNQDFCTEYYPIQTLAINIVKPSGTVTDQDEEKIVGEADQYLEKNDSPVLTRIWKNDKKEAVMKCRYYGYLSSTRYRSPTDRGNLPSSLRRAPRGAQFIAVFERYHLLAIILSSLMLIALALRLLFLDKGMEKEETKLDHLPLISFIHLRGRNKPSRNELACYLLYESHEMKKSYEDDVFLFDIKNSTMEKTTRKNDISYVFTDSKNEHAALLGVSSMKLSEARRTIRKEEKRLIKNLKEEEQEKGYLEERTHLSLITLALVCVILVLSALMVILDYSVLSLVLMSVLMILSILYTGYEYRRNRVSREARAYIRKRHLLLKKAMKDKKIKEEEFASLVLPSLSYHRMKKFFRVLEASSLTDREDELATLFHLIRDEKEADETSPDTESFK